MFQVVTDGHHEKDDGYGNKDSTDNWDNRHSLQPEKLILPEAGCSDIEKMPAGIHHRKLDRKSVV